MGSSTKAVLVVNDDHDLRRLIQLALESEGFRVVTAANGREALERVEQEMPGVILLDVRMPVMNGWEFVRAFRARHESNTPIVMLTAEARPWDAQVPADVHLAGAFDMDALIASVRHHLDAT